MAKKQKYYVVWEGNNTGVFDSWTETQLQIKGYPNARYKSFKTRAEAEAAYHGNFSDHIGNGDKKPKKVVSEEARKAIVWESIAVDAACSGNPGRLEYRGVLTHNKKEVFKNFTRILHFTYSYSNSQTISMLLKIIHLIK